MGRVRKFLKDMLLNDMCLKLNSLKPSFPIRSRFFELYKIQGRSQKNFQGGVWKFFLYERQNFIGGGVIDIFFVCWV